MVIDATFWVAISFFIFLGGLIYLKVPQKINLSLVGQIDSIKKELDEAEKLKVEAKNLLSDYESKIDKSKKETKEIISLARQNSEKTILEKTEKFHQIIEDRKKNAEQKIILMKENALRVEYLIKNSIDKEKIDKVYDASLKEIKTSLKQTKV